VICGGGGHYVQGLRAGWHLHPAATKETNMIHSMNIPSTIVVELYDHPTHHVEIELPNLDDQHIYGEILKFDNRYILNFDTDLNNPNVNPARYYGGTKIVIDHEGQVYYVIGHCQSNFAMYLGVILYRLEGLKMNLAQPDAKEIPFS
jgi:hypothetical protein